MRVHVRDLNSASNPHYSDLRCRFGVIDVHASVQADGNSMLCRALCIAGKLKPKYLEINPAVVLQMVEIIGPDGAEEPPRRLPCTWNILVFQ